MLVDTHCHIHEADYPLPIGDVLARAAEKGIGKMICVGTSEQSSREAIELAGKHDHLFASIGVHPHDTKDGYDEIARLATQPKVVAVGEIGLDYYYNHSPREVQIKALESQLQTVLNNNLPVIFHVRDASSAEQRQSVWSDFWSIYDNFQSANQRIRGVLHSFTDNQTNLDKALERGLYIGVNGISTFTKDATQQHLFAHIPLENLLLETDAPFLTPAPHRGTINEPAFVSEIAAFHATIRGIDPSEVASVTSANASKLFNLE